MANQEKPDAATLRELAVKHGIDPRTIVRALQGETIKGKTTREAAAAAVAEWKKLQKKGRTK